MAGTVLQFAVPDTPPPGTAGFVNPSFAGFGIEASSLVSFLGAEHPNTLTYNLLNNLANYTGKPPHIRLASHVQEDVSSPAQGQWPWLSYSPITGRGEQGSGHGLIDPLFFQAANRLPKNTPITWGLNFAYQGDDWTEQVTAVASEVFENCPNLQLTSFEISSEPNAHQPDGFQNEEQADGHVLARQWREQADAVYRRVLPLRNGTTGAFFEPAYTTDADGRPHSHGRNSDDDDSYYYFEASTVEEGPLTPAQLLRLRTTEDQFAGWTERVGQARGVAGPYVPRKLGIIGPAGPAAGPAAAFAAALWTLNLLLYTAARGVDTVQFHLAAAAGSDHHHHQHHYHRSSSGSGSAASPWQWEQDGNHHQKPQQPSAVRPTYYAFAAFDQLIGRGGEAQVLPITGLEIRAYGDDAARRRRRQGGREDRDDDDGDYLRAYAVYQSGSLASVVVLNTRPADASSQPADGKIAVQVQLPTAAESSSLSSLAGMLIGSRTGGRMAHLSYLASGVRNNSSSSSNADATATTSWNGLSYEASGDGTPTRLTTEPAGAGGIDGGRGGAAEAAAEEAVQVGADGTLRFEVRDMQAVVAHLGGRLGGDDNGDEGGRGVREEEGAGAPVVVRSSPGACQGIRAESGDGEDEDEQEWADGGTRETTFMEGLVLMSMIVMMGIVVFIG